MFDEFFCSAELIRNIYMNIVTIGYPLLLINNQCTVDNDDAQADWCGGSIKWKCGGGKNHPFIDSLGQNKEGVP